MKKLARELAIGAPGAKVAGVAASAVSVASTEAAIAIQAQPKTRGCDSTQATTAKPRSAGTTPRLQGLPARPHFIRADQWHTCTLDPLDGHGGPGKQFSVFETTPSMSEIHVLTAVSGKVQFRPQERKTAEGSFALWLQAQKNRSWNDDCFLAEAGLKQEFPELDGARKLVEVRENKAGALAKTCHSWICEYQEQDRPLVVQIPKGGHGWYVLLPESVRKVMDTPPFAQRLLQRIADALRAEVAKEATEEQIASYFNTLGRDTGGAARGQIDAPVHDETVTATDTKVVEVDGEKVRHLCHRRAATCVFGVSQTVAVGMDADSAPSCDRSRYRFAWPHSRAGCVRLPGGCTRTSRGRAKRSTFKLLRSCCAASPRKTNRATIPGTRWYRNMSHISRALSKALWQLDRQSDKWL